ncbi:MAG: HAD-IIIA family hydrolase [Candidatus Krumholzibacteriia bacterium]
MPQGSLRLLFMTSIPRWGGGERWMVDAAAGLTARAHAVLLVARRGAVILGRARRAGVATRAIHMGGDLDPVALLAVRWILSAHRPHAVFVNLDKELRYVCLASMLGSRPLVFPRRGSDVPLKHRWLQRYTYGSRVARILTNSRTLAETHVKSQAWLSPEAVRVMPNGVPVPDARADRNGLRRKLRLPRRQPLIVHVGELEPRKGQRTTLEALARILEHRQGTADKARIPNVAFIGSGPEEFRLHDRMHELGVQANVVWVGFRSDVEPYLAAADLLVLPSHHEGVPWTILEAMAQRLPVIASSVSGIPEIVRDGHNGLLVPPRDPAALARAIERLLDEPDFAVRLASNAFDCVRESWNVENMLSDLECLVYSQLLRQARVAPRPGGALFVDRDGTLVPNVPYNGDPDAVELQPLAGRALRWMRDAAVPVIVVSNQSGIARGLLTEEDWHAVNARIQELLGEHGARVDAFYHCPHHPDHSGPCDCRKPEPGMLVRAGAEHRIDMRRSLMVGDAERDLEAGRRAGARAAGYRRDGTPADIAPAAPTYGNWLTLVRDYLRDTYVASRAGVHVS